MVALLNVRVSAGRVDLAICCSFVDFHKIGHLVLKVFHPLAEIRLYKNRNFIFSNCELIKLILFIYCSFL